ncbi:MAG: 4Fe-4S double cluster binding domain-containing protein [Kiritimatiellia bacterium]
MERNKNFVNYRGLTPALNGVDRIRNLARRAGYADCGICGVEPFEEDRTAIAGRIERFPEAGHLYEDFTRRYDPRRAVSWAKSLIVCVRWYGKYRLPGRLEGKIGKNYLGDRRIKACPDNDMPRRFKAGLKDLGLKVKRISVPDRWAGVRAGVTRFGRNCFAYAGKYGSWINIESWVVDAELPHGEPTPEPACPDGCRACLDACPTGALAEPFCMRMDRCIPWLTYRAPEPVAPELWRKMGCWIYGCDICQDVCPLNRDAWKPIEPAPWLEDVSEHLTPQALAKMDQETYENIVHPLFWYIPKENLDRWHRNARRALERMSDRW